MFLIILFNTILLSLATNSADSDEMMHFGASQIVKILVYKFPVQYNLCKTATLKERNLVCKTIIA